MRFANSIPTAIKLVLLVGLGDWLLHGQRVGWNTGFFLTAALALLVVDRRSGKGAGAFRALAGLLLVVAAGLVLEPTTLGLLLAVLGVVGLQAVRRHGWLGDAASWGGAWATFLCFGWLRGYRDRKLRQRWERRQAQRAGRGLAAVEAAGERYGGWVLPVLLTAVFVGLFSAANPVWERALNLVWGWVMDFASWLSVDVAWLGHLWFWVWFGVVVWAVLRFKQSRLRLAAREPMAVQVLARGSGYPGLLVRCLVLFNIAFAVQNGMDALYLWTGSLALPAGMSYAQYAHRGAYPLVATALLAALFVLATFRANLPAGPMRTARRLVYLWLAQNVVLTLSALWRLSMYVEVYTLTRMRVAAMLWMMLVAVGLLLIGWRLLRGLDNRWLVNANFATLSLLLVAVSLMDVDGLIAHYNVRACNWVKPAGPPLDLQYLAHLGPASLPALMWLQEQGQEQGQGDGDAVGTPLSAEARWQVGLCAAVVAADMEPRRASWQGQSLRFRAWDRLAAQVPVAYAEEVAARRQDFRSGAAGRNSWNTQTWHSFVLGGDRNSGYERINAELEVRRAADAAGVAETEPHTDTATDTEPDGYYYYGPSVYRRAGPEPPISTNE